MRALFAVMTLFVLSIPVFSQEEKIDKILDEFLFGKGLNDSLLESMTIDDVNLNEIINTLYNYKYIYARAEFENKTFFSGQDLGISQYNISGQIYYQGSKGLNIGLAGLRYNDFEPKYNTTILTAGYNKYIHGVKGLNIRALYSRYIFAKVDSIKENAFNSSADLGLTYQWKVLGSSADIIGLMGNSSTVQVNWDLFADIPIFKFGLSKRINFEPQISFYFGNETVVISQYVNLPRYSGEITTEKRNFGLMNTMLRIQLSLTLKNLDISGGYNINFPRIPGSTDKPSNTSFFNLSVGYLFGL